MKWPMVKLEELATHIRNGVSVKQSPNAGGLKITRIETIAERKVKLNKCGYADLTENDYMDFRLKKGDILISHINSESHLGKCAIFEEERNDIVHGMNLLSFRTNRKVEPKYLYYALSSDSFLMKLKKITKKSVNQASFNVTSFKELDIPLPPLEEQKRIAAILDKADAIRQKRQQAIALADQFLRSVFLDMFGDPVTNPKEWDIYPLKKGITNITAGWSANGENHSCGDDEIGVLKISAVTSGIFKPNENKVVSSSSIPSNKKLVLPRKGDLLFSRANTRELVGATCIVDSDYDNIFLPDKLWVINLNSNELLPEYVHMLIQHPKFKECLTSQATGSSGSMLNISKAKFEGTLAPYPSLDVQQRFKDIFWKVMTCNALTNDSKINFDNQFNALSQKAFSGQL